MRGFFAAFLVLAAIGGGLFVLSGFSASSTSNSAIHEIEALIAALIVTVALAAGYIGSVLEANFNRMAPPQQQSQLPAAPDGIQQR